MLTISRPLYMDVKSVYTMTAAELRRAFRKASQDRASSSKYWDALLYRTSVVKSDLSLGDASAILDSLSRFPRYSSPLFLKYLLDPVPSKGRSALDAAMVLRKSQEMNVRTPDLEAQLSSIIVEKVTNSMRTDDLAKVARALARCNVVTVSMKQRIESLIANIDVDKVREPRTMLSFLNFLIVKPTTDKNTVHEDNEPFFSTTNQQDCTYEISRELTSKVFAKALSMNSSFNSKDVVDFAICVEKIVKDGYMHDLGHPIPGPIYKVISRQVDRQVKMLKPDELVKLITLDVDIDRSKLESECQYRIRDMKCKNCVELVTCGKFDPKKIPSLLARLHKFDACTSLSVQDVIQIGRVIANDPSEIGISLMKTLLPITKKASGADAEQVAEIYKSLEIVSHPPPQKRREFHS